MGTTATPAGLRERAPTPDDALDVLALINVCDIEDVGAPDYSLADVRSDWAYARFDLTEDARVLVDGDDRIRAYVAVRQHDAGRRFWSDLYVHPQARDGAPERWGVSFAQDRAAALADAPDASVFVYAEDGSDLAGILVGLGYADVRRMWRMELELDADAPPTVGDPPDGIAIRTFDPGGARLLHAAVEEAFAEEFGHVYEPFEEWAARKLEHEGFDPATWWVAWDGEELAGMVLASVDEGVDAAWISTVGVRSPWRGRGLALALLRTAFHGLTDRGVARVALGVDSRNPTGATRLYERAGMHVAKCWVRYERPVRRVGHEPARGDGSVRQ